MLRVYGNCNHEPSAGQYYRVRVPLRAMAKNKLINMHLDTPFSDKDERNNYLYCGDVSLHFMAGGGNMHRQFQMIRDFKPKPDAANRLKFPPVLVFDADDDLESISPLNPKFATLGTRDAENRLLDPRDNFGIKIGKNADPVFLWQHGQMTNYGSFSAGDNIIRHSLVRKVASTAHAITCTGDELADKIRKWNSNTHVYPNSLLFDDVVKINILRPSDEVRVLWQGGYSHYPDFYPLRGAFSKAAKKMPHIKWVFLGQLFKWATENIPMPRIEFYRWVRPGEDLQAYWLKFASLGADINLAPLVDNQFNICKSGIKFYEAAAHKIPTLAANAGPYGREIEDGVNGLLFNTPDEFVEKLELLVKDKDYRIALGKRAEEWVREHRDALKTCIPLYEFYEKLHVETGNAKLAA